MLSRLAWAGTAVAALALAGCGNVVDGVATCPGCGTDTEPTAATPRTPAPRPTAAPAPTITAPAPQPTAPGPSGAERLPADAQGYVFIETKSGQTRCQLTSEYVGCEAAFQNSPQVSGTPANGVRISSDGAVSWILGNLGAIPVVTIDYRTYSAVGWTIEASSSGTRFTNDATGRGAFVSLQRVEGF